METSNGKCKGDVWEEHLQDFKEWGATTDAIHRIVAEMHGDTKYLSTLPEIAREIRAMRDSLVGPATDRRFVPIGPIMAVLAFMGMALMLLGVLAIAGHVPVKSIKMPNMEISAR